MGSEQYPDISYGSCIKYMWRVEEEEVLEEFYTFKSSEIYNYNFSSTSSQNVSAEEYIL